MSSDKLLCECSWRGTQKEVLRAPNPFDPDDELWGCPRCRTPGGMRVACDEPECWNEVCCGTPTPTGYRQTCSKHRPKDKEPLPAPPSEDGNER